MKNLLSILSTLIIGTSSSMVLVNNNKQFIENDNSDQVLYWNDDHSNREFSVAADWNSIGKADNWFTFNIGTSKSFNSISFLNSKGFSFSWGDTRYGNWWFNGQEISLDDKNNAIINSNNFNNYLQVLVYDELVNDSLAKCHSVVKLGWAWYEENGSYYFQFLIHQYLNPMNSFSGGANFANLGTALQLSKIN